MEHKATYLCGWSPLLTDQLYYGKNVAKIGFMSYLLDKRCRYAIKLKVTSFKMSWQGTRKRYVNEGVTVAAMWGHRSLRNAF